MQRSWKHAGQAISKFNSASRTFTTSNVRRLASSPTCLAKRAQSLAEADSRPVKAVRQLEFQTSNVNPYPRLATAPQNAPLMNIREIKAKWENVLEKAQKADQQVTLNGRIISKRESSSKLVFYDVMCDGDVLQVVASKSTYKGTAESFVQINKILCRGDIIAVSGLPGKTNHGQLSVYTVDKLELLAPCLHDIPKSKLNDAGKRFRNRHVDFLTNPDAINTLRTRSKIIQYIRHFLDSRGFLEVETPILSTLAGGANAKPFATTAHALDMEMQLRIAPELYLKQLVIGGLDRVYEIGKQFRNEGIDADHNPEFTTCEYYQAYGNLENLLADTETMIRSMVKHIRGTLQVQLRDGTTVDFASPFRRLNVLDEIERKTKRQLPNLNSKDSVTALLDICREQHIHVPQPHTISRILDKLISGLIEPDCVQPTFLLGHPLVMSPLAKDSVDQQNRHVAARFELFVATRELVNAYEELNDPDEQRKRFVSQQQDRLDGDGEAQEADHRFCDAIEYGLPPTAGWGMGIDRVVQLLTENHHIREVLAFPIVRNE
ncbi:hypothetical protein INT43_000376 [Umbelopsis isabellina]|uniref:Lysine--tRNA ligase n=1 Tax=Mortierella isabellina TaxID=91625 RepID=A0A8H7Q1N3_MORIS|nr:hypothetical protein INT43_000376 [Umbelopsis isabellina]